MSDEPLGTLVSSMLDQLAQLRQLVVAQQETLLGIRALLETHGTGLQMHQRVIELMASELGIAFDPPEDPAPTGPVN